MQGNIIRPAERWRAFRPPPTNSATQALNGINALVGVGARTIVFTTGDVGQLPEATGNPAAAIGTAYSQNYNAQMQAALAAIARSGVRVELVDVSAARQSDQG